jgi:transposase-like protein
MMRSRRKFNAEFKTQVVLQVLSGEKSLAEVCREHQLSAQMMGNWKQQFLVHASRVFDSEAANSAEQERIAELERMVGKLTMELEIAKKASSIAHSLAHRNGR